MVKEVSTDINEFEELAGEETPQGFSSVPAGTDMIASTATGVEYNFEQALETSKAPPRIDLNGKIVTIEDAKIILPSTDKPWDISRDGKTQYKYCIFKLYYSEGGQQEFLSGLRVFKRMEGNLEKYSHPQIFVDGKNQSSALLKKYAEFKGKNPKEVSMKEFLSYLKSKPKVQIVAEVVTNPNTNEKVTKNIPGKFL